MNHQCNEDKAQNVHKKKKLDVTLVYGERDFEDTKTRMFLCVTLKENCGGFVPLYSSPTSIS